MKHSLSQFPLPQGNRPAVRQTKLVVATDVLLGLIFIVLCAPASLVGHLRILDIPLSFLLFYVVFIFSVLSYMKCKQPLSNKYHTLVLILCFYMIVLGVIFENDIRFMFIDITNMLGYILGFYWAATRSFLYLRNLIPIWASVIFFVMFINTLGLYFGFFPKPNIGERLYNYSIFFSAGFIATLFPFWFFCSSNAKFLGNGSWLSRYSKLISILAVVLVFAVSFMSATRSMFLGISVSSILVFWIIFRRGHSAKLIYLIFFLLILIIGVFIQEDFWHASYLSERLFSVSLRDEARYVELENMFDALFGYYFSGMGFGSKFYSGIFSGGDYLAYAPHVGITTLLYKGGVFVFSLTILAPLLLSVKNMFFAKRSLAKEICSATILMYCINSSFSGGWDPISLFIFSAMISTVCRNEHEKLSRA